MNKNMKITYVAYIKRSDLKNKGITPLFLLQVLPVVLQEYSAFV